MTNNQQIAKIKRQIKNVAKEIFGKEFEFRPHQLEAILIIVCKNLSKNINYQIMNAPTGAGKSIIAIIAAKVLWKYYEKTSYILVSDLSLFEQYINDITYHKITEIGYLKGKDNYICKKNTNKVNCAVCSLNNIPLFQLLNVKFVKGFRCKDNCEYIQDYKKAINSPITIMTYQLYFIQRNYVAEDIFNGENKNFPLRDLVICDEAHKLCDIVQTHFSPVISIERPAWMLTLDDYASSINEHYMDENDRLTIIDNLKVEEDKSKLIQLIQMYEQYVRFYTKLNEKLRDNAKESKDKKYYQKYLIAGNLAREVHCKLDDLLSFVNKLKNFDYIVKTVDSKNITINYVFENIMLARYFHSKNKNELLMSATIGDYDTYLNMIGLDENQSTFLNISSTFDYANSPIYITDKNKMSWKEKDKSIQTIKSQVIELCNKHVHERGIIQTGNYENAKFLYDHVPTEIRTRMIFYFSSKDKIKALTQFNNSTNAILIGPTLLEGLNFPGDNCRFSICVKLPYANLSNKLVEAKKNLIKNWYTYDVITKLEQGFGRGVRYNGDWCINYILDGCISDLLKYNNFNKNTQLRIKKFENEVEINA